MNVSTIAVPRSEAEEKLREYRRRVHRHAHVDAESEYARVLQAYEAAADGAPLLVLSQVMEAVPRDAMARPRLAIGRADARQVEVSVGTNRDTFDVREIGGRHRGPRRDAVVGVTRPTPAALTLYRQERRAAGDTGAAWLQPVGYALVPLVPPNVARGRDLSRHFTLWEVEHWATERIQSGPDRDPYLLRRVATDLFVVVGEWALTALEQSVMRDRAGRRP